MGIYDKDYEIMIERYDRKADKLSDKLYAAYNNLHSCKHEKLRAKLQEEVKELEHQQRLHSDNYGYWIEEPEDKTIKKYVDYLEKKGYIVTLDN